MGTAVRTFTCTAKSSNSHYSIKTFNWTTVLVYKWRGRIDLLTESMSHSATVGGDAPFSLSLSDNENMNNFIALF